MPAVTLDFLSQQLELAEQLRAGGAAMFEPQDLPGRFGRVIQAVDRILAAMGCPALLGGGWAVWRHGYIGCVTGDVDIVVPADRIDEFLQVAGISGFEVLPRRKGHWPKLRHKETGIEVDLLPEGGRPGTAKRPAPTTIPHPEARGGKLGPLAYVSLPFLIELKLAAGRARDDADVAELLRVHAAEADKIRQHLQTVHEAYVTHFDELRKRAGEQDDD